MAQNDRNMQASLLDRLVDLEPGLSHEPVQYRLLNESQILALVIRDLERLLNTRREVTPVPAGFEHLRESVFTYGLRDFTALNPQSTSVRRRMSREIEDAVSRFEPRLRNVSVQLDKVEGSKRDLRFRISGLLVVEPMQEPVTFDTYFDVNRGEYVIRR